MPSLAQRMRKLQTKLIAIRHGSGALLLPKEVKRIHMRFAPKLEGGHMGPRKFWKHELIRLKYHNPAVPMTVDRNVTQDGDALMSVHFVSPDTVQNSSANSSPAPSESATSGTSIGDHDPTERVETINMKNITNSEILQRLVEITKAVPVEPTEEEQEEMRLLQEQSVKSARDARVSLEARERVKREKELLQQARGDVAGQAE